MDTPLCFQLELNSSFYLTDVNENIILRTNSKFMSCFKSVSNLVFINVHVAKVLSRKKIISRIFKIITSFLLKRQYLGQYLLRKLIKSLNHGLKNKFYIIKHLSLSKDNSVNIKHGHFTILTGP
jgi:hypothetical protein